MRCSSSRVTTSRPIQQKAPARPVSAKHSQRDDHAHREIIRVVHHPQSADSLIATHDGVVDLVAHSHAFADVTLLVGNRDHDFSVFGRHVVQGGHRTVASRRRIDQEQPRVVAQVVRGSALSHENCRERHDAAGGNPETAKRCDAEECEREHRRGGTEPPCNQNRRAQPALGHHQRDGCHHCEGDQAPQLEARGPKVVLPKERHRHAGQSNRAYPVRDMVRRQCRQDLAGMDIGEHDVEEEQRERHVTRPLGNPGRRGTRTGIRAPYDLE